MNHIEHNCFVEIFEYIGNDMLRLWQTNKNIRNKCSRYVWKKYKFRFNNKTIKKNHIELRSNVQNLIDVNDVNKLK